MQSILLVSDYDGTLYTDEINIRINLEAINRFRSNGGTFLLNTGRPFSTIKPKIIKYNIKYDYLGCLDGIMIFDQKDKILYFEQLALNHHELMKELQEFNLQILRVDCLEGQESIVLEKSFILLDPKEKEKLHQRIDELIATKYPNLDVTRLVHKGLQYYFLRNRDIDKSSAVQKVMNLNNISKRDVFTIGDEGNDLPMIKDYNGYVMNNSQEELFDYALGGYNHVYELIIDIEKNRVLRR